MGWNRKGNNVLSLLLYKQLTELDIYHRILRFKNYSVAMMNKSILPARVYLPFFGDTAVLSRGLRYNIDWILFGKNNQYEFEFL